MAALALGEWLLSGTGGICRGGAKVYLFVDVLPRGLIWTVVYRKVPALDLCCSQSTPVLCCILSKTSCLQSTATRMTISSMCFSPADENGQSDAIAAMESCDTVIRNWMHENRLLMKETKTEFLLIGMKQQFAKVNVDHVKVDNANIVPHSPVKNLGMWLV